MNAERRLFHDLVVVVPLLAALLMTLAEGARAEETAPADRAFVEACRDALLAEAGRITSIATRT